VSTTERTTSTSAGRVRTWWDGLGRPERILVALFGATLAMRLFVYGGIAGGILIGDEAYYLDSARALSNALRDLAGLGAPDTAELDRIVVGSGWFMPGMSVVLTPLFLVAPQAPVALVRAYLSVFSALLLLLTVLRVRRTFGNGPAGALLVFPGLVPTYAAFGAAAWGDTSAGLVVVLMVCQAVDMLRTVRERGSVSWRAGVGLGLYAIVAVYFRSSASLLVVGMLGLTFVVSLVLAARAERRRVVVAYVAAGVAFLAVLAPWSVAASTALEARVVTTVSVPTVRANTFGDSDLVCFGECDPGSSIWFSPLRYSREQAAATGLSEVDIADEMSAYARQGVTPTSYARDVIGNTGRYLGNPSRFSVLLRWSESPYDVVWFSQVLTWGMFYPMVLVMLALLVTVTRRGFDHQLQLILLKVGVMGLLAQPFVHMGGPRYWTTMAPLLGIGLAVLWGIRRDRQAGVEPWDGDGHPLLARFLRAVQWGLTLLAAAIVLGVALVAL
jgi:hypothetical protein